MAKPPKSKPSGTRNAERRNGKAWGRNSRGSIDTQGHNATGRTKPSGRSIKGMRVARERDYPDPLAIKA